jgi:uncharacterized membrane protein
MRAFIEFLKTTIIGGFFVLLPVVVVLFLISLAVATVVTALTPLMEVLPIKGMVGIAVTTLAAILILLVFCFLTGLLVQMRIGRLGKERVERFLLERLPGYIMFKNLTRRIAGEEGIEFAPGLMDLYGSEARALGFIIEEHENGTFTIFVPLSPMATVGQVFILPGSQVQKLGVKFVDVVNSLTQWGMESKKLFPPMPPINNK